MMTNLTKENVIGSHINQFLLFLQVKKKYNLVNSAFAACKFFFLGGKALYIANEEACLNSKAHMSNCQQQ